MKLKLPDSIICDSYARSLAQVEVQSIGERDIAEAIERGRRAWNEASAQR